MNTQPFSTCFNVLLVATLCALAACSDGENQAPTVILNPEGPEKTYVVGDTAFISVLAEDPDGDALTFEFKHRTSNDRSTIDNATFVKTATSATLNWSIDTVDVTASGEPVEMIFIVKDERGAEVQRKLDVSILPGNGVPRFESSANQIYRGCCDKPLSFEVRVRDDDDERVNLAMTPQIPGATFEQTGAKKGRFTWTPTPTQANQRIHAFQFSADDGKSATVYQDATVVIFSEQDVVVPVDPASDSVCEGENAITHTPLKSGYYEDPEILIEATFSKALGDRYDKVGISWTDTEDPVAQPNAIMGTGDAFIIENGILGNIFDNSGFQSSDIKTIYYKICLIDSDAVDEDALLCAPSTPNLYYSFFSYKSADTVCLDQSPNNDIDTSPAVAIDQWKQYRLCGEPDYHSIPLAPGQKKSVVLSYSKGAQLTTTLLDENNQEVPDLVKQSNCTGLTTITVEAPANAGKTYKIKVEGNEIPYNITSINEGGGNNNTTCADESNEPNQTLSKATPLGSSQSLDNLAICPEESDRDLYLIQGLQVGQTIEIKMSHQANMRNLGIEFYAPSTPESSVGSIGAGVAFADSFDLDDEIITHNVTQCGDHALLVYPNASTGPYSLTTSIFESSCQDDDEFTCNHQQANAELFAWNKTYNLKACGKVDDWFRHKGNAASILAEVTATSGNVDDITFEVYDRDGNKLAESSKVNNGQELSATFPDDEMYYFRVSSTSEVSYDLFVAQI